jgi:hypothetical protein
MNQTTSSIRQARIARVPFGIKVIGIAIGLAILGAGLHLPQMAGASQQSQDATLAECLRYMRTQIYVYSLEHNNIPPGFRGNDLGQAPDAQTFVEQMTQYTDASGRIISKSTDSPARGPYMVGLPANPLTLKSGLWVTTGDGLCKPDEFKPFGWIYNPVTRQICANVVGADSHGVSYASY